MSATHLEALILLYATDKTERDELLYQFAKNRDENESFVNWLRKQPEFQQATQEQIEYVRNLTIR